jgi:U3 small nucleolar RNA-associated protein 20
MSFHRKGFLLYCVWVVAVCCYILVALKYFPGSCTLQVIGLLVDDHTLRMSKHLKSIVAVAKKIMESSAIASGILQSGLPDETVLPLWKEAYHSVAMTERLLIRFPELYFGQNMEV